MSGRNPVTSGGKTATTPPRSSVGGSSVSRAWEDFVSGAVSVRGVRPEILASWARCRDAYGVDPALALAPGAPDREEHHLGHDVVFAQLGGLAATAVNEIAHDRGIVTVTDGSGRVLASWGESAVRRRADDSNLAPWAAWSERATGTNGMGTALETTGPVMIDRAEHWCSGFQQWSCAGVAIRNPVTGSPIAALNVSRLGAPLSARVPDWLGTVARTVGAGMRNRAIADGRSVVSAFEVATSASRRPLAGLDVGGRMVIADAVAGELLGITNDGPVLDPASRPVPQPPMLQEVIRWATGRARQDPQWTGYAHLVPGDLQVAVLPVFQANHLVGVLCQVGAEDGEPYVGRPAVAQMPTPARVIGVRNDRLILLSPSEIRYAEADHNIVWLTTDRGRIQASERGLDKLLTAVGGHDFIRVHRRYVVNLRRVREIERGSKGELALVTDTRSTELIPVSRRHAPGLRRLLGF